MGESCGAAGVGLADLVAGGGAGCLGLDSYLGVGVVFLLDCIAAAGRVGLVKRRHWVVVHLQSLLDLGAEVKTVDARSDGLLFLLMAKSLIQTLHGKRIDSRRLQ